VKASQGTNESKKQGKSRCDMKGRRCNFRKLKSKLNHHHLIIINVITPTIISSASSSSDKCQENKVATHSLSLSLFANQKLEKGGWQWQ